MRVREPREGHLCCGSAGTYNILQPEIAARLRDRKVKNIAATGADLVATGNIGCMTQIGRTARRAGRPHGGAARLGLWRADVPQALAAYSAASRVPSAVP